MEQSFANQQVCHRDQHDKPYQRHHTEPQYAALNVAPTNSRCLVELPRDTRRYERQRLENFLAG